MTFYEDPTEAADEAMKTPKPAIPSSHEPSRATQSQDLYEVPKSKTKSSTHLGITIRWGAAPPSYLPVAIGGGAAPAALRPPAGRWCGVLTISSGHSAELPDRRGRGGPGELLHRRGRGR